MDGDLEFIPLTRTPPIFESNDIWLEITTGRSSVLSEEDEVNKMIEELIMDFFNTE